MNELTVKNPAVLSKIASGQLGDLLKPLQKEIFLLDVFLYEVGENCTTTQLRTLKQADELVLRRQKNAYDEFTVEAYTQENVCVGEIGDSENEIFARLLDAGKQLKTKIKRVGITPDNNFILLSIFMVEF